MKFRHVYFDNSFTSPVLVERLLEDGIYCAGTLRATRRGIPPEIIGNTQTTRDDARFLAQNSISVLKWVDRKPKYIMSNFSDRTQMTVITRRLKNEQTVQVRCLVMIQDYNYGNIAVDRADQRVQYYAVDRVRCIQRVSAETQLNSSEGNVAGKAGIGGIGGKGVIKGKEGEGGIRNIGGKRDKGDSRDLPKRHQSLARTLTWCPAVYVTETNAPSPSRSSAVVQCMLRKVSLLRLHPHLVPCSVCRGKCLSFALTLISCRAVYVGESVCPSPAPSPGALQCILGKVSVLHPGILLRLNF